MKHGARRVVAAALLLACRPPDAERTTDDTTAIAIAANLPPAPFDSAALRIVDFLRGGPALDNPPDSVTLYVVPEGGGGRRTLRRSELRDRRNWRVRSGSATYSLVPPPTFLALTSKFGMHFQCMERSLDSRLPRLARLPHVGVKLQPADASSCLQSWNVTFVFDAALPPRLVAAVYDQWEW